MRELERRKIHISAIRETNLPNDLNYARNGYRIITAATHKKENQHISTCMYQSGVAILAQKEIRGNIDDITRIDRRIMTIAIKAKGGKTDLHPRHIRATHRLQTGRDAGALG